MKIYLISQSHNHDYETFDSAIVIAENEDQAKHIHPGGLRWILDCWHDWYIKDEHSKEKIWGAEIDHTWCDPKDVAVKLLGDLYDMSDYTSGDVILSSFNAG